MVFTPGIRCAYRTMMAIELGSIDQSTLSWCAAWIEHGEVKGMLNLFHLDWVIVCRISRGKGIGRYLLYSDARSNQKAGDWEASGPLFVYLFFRRYQLIMTEIFVKSLQIH
jgi:hypothetical protein